MSDMSKETVKKGGKKKMTGRIIALIVVAALFLTGAICCNTIGKGHGDTKSTSSSIVNDK
jgi:hypothetical protein